MNEMRILGTSLTAQIGGRSFSANLWKSPAALTLTSGSYRVAQAMNNLVWGDIVLLLPAHSTWEAQVNRVYTTIQLCAPSELVRGQASGGSSQDGLLITSRAVTGVPSLVMPAGLGDLVAALNSAGDVTVQIG